jgi:hypothetical protein
MPVTLQNTSISGLAAGGLPNGVITRPLIGYSGAIVQRTFVQTRTQATYAAPVTGNGTSIAALQITITPQKAGNIIILEYMIANELHWDTVYTITRNDVLLPDATNASNNRWAGINGNNYESAGNQSSTPVLDTITFTDTNSLATASTYRILVRSSNATARTYYLNRTVSSAGADNNEAGVSTVIATEINV